MAIKYDDEMLQEINEKADLLAYVRESLDLVQKGDDYFAHCPLHEDKTPSLSFTPSENSFYCFSCGAKGKMIGYLMQFEGLTFDEAVEKASRIAKIDTSQMCQSPTIILLKKWRPYLTPKQVEVAVHPEIKKSELYRYKLKPAEEWLDENISAETQKEFGIRIDDIGNRIVYPVFDINGKLINIKGRTRYTNYKKLDIAKYINYYKIGTMDYLQSLEKALPYIREQHEVIVFESIKSVMKAYEWGYKNCISAEKHTLTPEQILLLVSLHADIVIGYDTDVDYSSGEVAENIDKLKRVTNVYIIADDDELLGGIATKNSPVDCGLEIWEELYANKRKVV